MLSELAPVGAQGTAASGYAPGFRELGAVTVRGAGSRVWSPERWSGLEQGKWPSGPRVDAAAGEVVTLGWDSLMTPTSAEAPHTGLCSGRF